MHTWSPVPAPSGPRALEVLIKVRFTDVHLCRSFIILLSEYTSNLLQLGFSNCMAGYIILFVSFITRILPKWTSLSMLLLIVISITLQQLKGLVIYKVRSQFKIFDCHLGRHLGFFKMLKGDRVSYSRFLERTPSRSFWYQNILCVL